MTIDLDRFRSLLQNFSMEDLNALRHVVEKAAGDKAREHCARMTLGSVVEVLLTVDGFDPQGNRAHFEAGTLGVIRKCWDERGHRLQVEQVDSPKDPSTGQPRWWSIVASNLKFVRSSL